MSVARAFSGETYTTWARPATASPRSWAPQRASMATRKADSVLPDPVGALTSVSAPARTAGQAPACAGVGPSGKRCENQARTAGWKPASGSPAAGAVLSAAVSTAVTFRVAPPRGRPPGRLGSEQLFARG